MSLKEEGNTKKEKSPSFLNKKVVKTEQVEGERRKVREAGTPAAQPGNGGPAQRGRESGDQEKKKKKGDGQRKARQRKGRRKEAGVVQASEGTSDGHKSACCCCLRVLQRVFHLPSSTFALGREQGWLLRSLLLHVVPAESLQREQAVRGLQHRRRSGRYITGGVLIKGPCV
ncbi:hypothetical protein R1flu_019764 [Riccia fluitans]|uniref:Uncharacterized protein n=1 Tax=Riccia fluitans TaxID=41844 RepID=A0ABD1ZLR8_9MARC